MIKVENIEIGLLATATRGIRNPHNSHEKSDSRWRTYTIRQDKLYVDFDKEPIDVLCPDFIIGDNDIDLFRRLTKAGAEHRKGIRQIFVGMDITAPLFWWKEMDQYKVGTVTDSCSTMHKIHSKKFELDDFSHDSLDELTGSDYIIACEHWNGKISCLNYFRDKYNETKDKTYWRQIIEHLPSSYNQKRTITFSYENDLNIIKQRVGHKLTEWNNLCEVLEKLPYIKSFRGE